MEAASGVIAVVSLAGQVLQGCGYIRQVFEAATTAPEEIRLLTTELAVIEQIVRAVPNDSAYEDALDFCNEAVAKLRCIIDKYTEPEGPQGLRKWGRRLKMALSTDKIQKYLNRLQQAKTHLQDLQHLTTRSQNVVEYRNFQSSVRQIKESQIESAIIVSRTEGKLEELSKTSKDTQHAFHDFAGRLVQQDRIGRFPEEQCIQRIEAKLEQLFAKHVSGFSLQERSMPTDTPWPIDQYRRPSQKLSADDCGLAWSTKSSSASTSEDVDIHDSQEVEMISSYKTWLGRVYMRTVATTYLSADEVSVFALRSCFGSFSKSTNFPITVSVTEIRLIPRTWSPNRAANIRYQQVLGPTSKMANISFEINSHGSSSTSPLQQTYEVVNCTPDIKGKVADLSQSMMYTAFKTAFLAIQAQCAQRSTPQQIVSRTPFPRSSFDGEVNDIIELVHLWIHSGLDADSCRDAFPGDITKSREQSQLVFRVNSEKLWPVQRLRHEYVFNLVMEITANYHRDDWLQGKCLDSIHEDHWERCQTMAYSSAASPGVHSRSTCEVPARTPVFQVAWKGKASTLFEIFRSGVVSPFSHIPGRKFLLRRATLGIETRLMIMQIINDYEISYYGDVAQFRARHIEDQERIYDIQEWYLPDIDLDLIRLLVNLGPKPYRYSWWRPHGLTIRFWPEISVCSSLREKFVRQIQNSMEEFYAMWNRECDNFFGHLLENFGNSSQEFDWSGYIGGFEEAVKANTTKSLWFPWWHLCQEIDHKISFECIYQSGSLRIEFHSHLG